MIYLLYILGAFLMYITALFHDPSTTILQRLFIATVWPFIMMFVIAGLLIRLSDDPQ